MSQKKKVIVKKKGFSVVSLLIGLLLGIIIMVALVGGAAVYLATGSLDSILSLFGLDNQDDDGNYIYINTDPDNGGVSTVLQLVQWVTGLDSITSLSVYDVCEKVPYVETVVDGLYDTIADYGLEMDKDELYSQPFDGLLDYVTDALMDVQVGTLLDKVDEDNGLKDNKITEAILYGTEAKYVEVPADDGSVVKYPVWYEDFRLVDPDAPSEEPAGGNEAEEGDGNDNASGVNYTEPLDLDLSDDAYFVSVNDENVILDEEYYGYLAYSSRAGAYRLYFYGPMTRTAAEESGDGEETEETETTYYYNVTYREDDGSFACMETPVEYTTSYATLDGSYYYDADGNKVDSNPVTIGSIMDNPLENLYELYITDLYEDNEEELGAIADILGDVSFGDLIEGNVNFEEIINGLELSSLINNVSISDDSSGAAAILTYLIYGASGVSEAEGEDLAYSYTGTYHKIAEDGTTETVDCYIQTDADGTVLGIYLDKDCTESAAGTTVTQVETRMDGIMNDLTIGEIVDVSSMDNEIVNMVAGSTIGSFATDIGNMTMNQLFCNDIYGVWDEEQQEQLATQYEVVATAADVTDETTQIAFDSSYTYYIQGSSVILEPAGQGYSSEDGTPGNGHYDTYDDLVESVGEGVTVYTYGQANPLWKLLISETNSDGELQEIAYSVSDMNNMYYNITSNVQNATVSDLVDAGILSIDNAETVLDSYLVSISYDAGGSPTISKSETKVGDMTLIGLINAILSGLTTS
ncbi:MAG: hypothetical protein LUE27_05925 [Clostridia bacterium]|nr:hypothetical protein [Clostridia bacterium]